MAETMLNIVYASCHLILTDKEAESGIQTQAFLTPQHTYLTTTLTTPSFSFSLSNSAKWNTFRLVSTCHPCNNPMKQE